MTATKHTTSRRVIAIVVLNAILALFSTVLTELVGWSSTSVVTNMYLILGWAALVSAVSYLEAVAIRDLVARGGWRGAHEIGASAREQPRPWRDLHLPLTIAILALLGLNMLVFDQLSGDFYIGGQRVTYTVTRIRSDDAALEREGIMTASQTKDPRIRRALVEHLARGGRSRPLAAWALGKVGTLQDAESLASLLRGGSNEDRAAAGVALGRLGYEGLAKELEPRLRRPEEPLESYLYGLGILGSRQALASVVELMHRETTAPDHLALSAWALGRFGDRRACPVLGELIEPVANPLTCAALCSIERLRCDHVADPLIEAFERSDPEERCDAQHFVDLDGRSYELWSSGLFRVNVLHCLVQSPSPEVLAWLRALSRDSRQVPQIRDLARRSTRAIESRERRSSAHRSRDPAMP